MSPDPYLAKKGFADVINIVNFESLKQRILPSVARERWHQRMWSKTATKGPSLLYGLWGWSRWLWVASRSGEWPSSESHQRNRDLWQQPQVTEFCQPPNQQGNKHWGRQAARLPSQYFWLPELQEKTFVLIKALSVWWCGDVFSRQIILFSTRKYLKHFYTRISTEIIL